ncbi:MAG TPA: hypothetical protein VE619_04555 [Nitrososphaeraceae archaeon]|nr:hypothetical protein [Nitrososphaeraceae archaeon]
MASHSNNLTAEILSSPTNGSLPDKNDNDKHLALLECRKITLAKRRLATQLLRISPATTYTKLCFLERLNYFLLVRRLLHLYDEKKTALGIIILSRGLDELLQKDANSMRISVCVLISTILTKYLQ